MKVKKIVKTTVKTAVELEITGATLLTIEEARKLPERLKKYDGRWWLRSSGYNDSRATAVLDDGLVYSCSIFVDTFYIAVRPALIISNLESSGLKIGDTFEFGDKEFEIVSSDKAFCLSDIGMSAFRNDWRAPDANDYEKSDIKKFIDEWFKRVKETETERITAMPIKHKRFLYHVTDPENVESILRNGLLRGGGKRQAAFVCLSEKPLSWWYPGAKILKVDIKDLMGEWSDFLSESDEILFWGDIPAERIKVYEPTAVEHIKMFNSNLYDWRKKENSDAE